ncbi:uncharacterized protein LOC120780794 [Bactrocera tryoni]|uniref:uncharacterized protein LOC120780794 n=1 Tax=Bactrocera tryoni TaxID=59916 RepID=UPI001A95C781|nr:uncharacterized protein LOC120780794 [Bactrocera tryoni]
MGTITIKQASQNEIVLVRLLWDQAYQQPKIISLLADVERAGLCRTKPPCYEYVYHGVLGQATKFGWILSGIVKAKVTGKITTAVTNLERFWEIEDISTDDDVQEDDTTLKQYEETTKRDADGRFIVEIPFKKDKELGESRKKAVARLISMENRFKSNSKLKEEYSKFIKEYIDLGHMRKVDDKQKRIQNAVIELLIDLNQGRINPTLLTPTQLQTELMLIKDKLPAKLLIPGQQTNTQLRDVYNLMKTRGLIVDDKLVIKAELPLIQSESSEIYKLIVIPHEYNGRLLKAKLRNEFLVYNFGLNSYFLMSQAELNKCTKSLNNHLICKGKSPWQPALDQTCELSALLKSGHTNCKYEEVTKSIFWSELFEENTWIFKVFKNSTIHLDCQKGKTQILDIPAQGILSIKAGCTARYESITLIGMQIFKMQSDIKPTLDPIVTTIKEIAEDHITTLQISRIDDNEQQRKLREDIDKISNNELKLSELNLRNHSGHISLVLVVIVILCLLILYFRYKCKANHADRIIVNIPNR